MIYSKVTGEGLPVVLLHGYAEDHSLWDDLASSLARQFQIITLDLPGFGRSPRIPGSFSIEDVAETVFTFLTVELELSEFVVFGHSLGGYVTLALAGKFPERIRGFGLINSTALEDSPEKKVNRLKTADFIQKHEASFFLSNFVPNLFTKSNQRLLIQEIEFVIAMGQNLDESLLADYMLAMRERPNLQQLLSEYEHVLFIGGEKDSGFTANDYDLQISSLKKKTNGHILQNVAHMSMYEAPEELLEISLGFLKSI